MSDSRIDAVLNYFNKRIWLNSDIEINNRMEIVKVLLQGIENKKILDVGCGDGRISLQFKSNNLLLLLDISSKMLESARKNVLKDEKNVRLVQADFLEYETDEKFDIVICIGVLAHVKSVKETLVKISSVMMDGGTCIIQFTNCANFIGWLDRNYYDLRARLRGIRNYNLNKISTRMIEKICSDLPWQKKALIRYYSPSQISNIFSRFLELKNVPHLFSEKMKMGFSSEIIACYEKVNEIELKCS